MAVVNSYSSRLTKARKPKVLATELKLEDFLTGANPQEELAELARIVTAKFRKYFEPLLERRFEGNLRNRKFVSTLRSSDLTKELREFLNSLSRKEYIAFLLFADEEIFDRQPRQVKAILSELKFKARALLSDQNFYSGAETSSQSAIYDSKLSGEKSRVERLITSEADPLSKGSSLFEELESRLLRRLDYSVNSIFQRDTDANKTKQPNGLEANEFDRRIMTILDEHMEITKIEGQKQQRNAFPIPGELLEKLFLPVVLAIKTSLPRAVPGMLTEILTESIDLIRLLDLMLVILSFPEEKASEFTKIFKNHFHFDPIHPLKFIKGSIYTCLFELLYYRMTNTICIQPFEELISKLEDQFGVLPLKRKLSEVSPMKYEKDKLYIELWDTATRKAINEKFVAGKAAFACLLKIVSNSDTYEKDSTRSEAGIKALIRHLNETFLATSDTYTLTKVNAFIAVKHPRLFELVLELFTTAENQTKLKGLKKHYEQISACITLLSQQKQPEGAEFSIGGLGRYLQGYDMFTAHMVGLYLTLLNFIPEAINRLSNPSLYTKAQKASLSNFSKLLKQFVADGNQLQIQSIMAESLKKMEELIGDSPDQITIRFLTSTCAYVFLFYMLTQAQEELDYALSLGQELHSPELLKIKSKAVDESKDKKSGKSPDRSGNTLNLDEIMFSLSSKCSKVFKIYLPDYVSAVVPWVIPQSIRLQFIRFTASSDTKKLIFCYLGINCKSKKIRRSRVTIF